MAVVAPSVDGASTENALSRRIRWEVDKDSISTFTTTSPPIEVGGIPWAIGANKDANGDNLGLFLYRMDYDFILKSVDATFEIKLLNYEDDTKSINIKFSKTLNCEVCSWGRRSVIRWNDAIDEEKGFIKDGKFTVQVQFQLSNIHELRNRRHVDCTNSTEPTHDAALIIEGEKIYVNKGYLSILSTVFQAMFYGQFIEKDLTEIELKDIDRKEFDEMMKVIYPPHKKISDENFEFLLKLGDRFEIYMVLDQCEQFLITSNKLTVTAKLKFAGLYRLCKLQDHCFDKLTTIKEVTDLKNSDDFKNLSDSVKLALFDKILKLSD